MRLEDKHFMKPEYKKNFTVAFDTDLTLIDHQDRPLYKNIAILLYFVDLGYKVYAWSGGGMDYCERHMRRLGLEEKVEVIAKGSILVDIAFDDEIVKLGKVNIVVE